MVDLDPLLSAGAALATAAGINDSGQIVASGTVNGQTGYCWLTLVGGDIVGPAPTADVLPHPNAADRNNTGVFVTLHAAGADDIADTVVPVRGAALTAEMTFRLPNNTDRGVTTITYSATDAAGNAGSPQTLVIRIN